MRLKILSVALAAALTSWLGCLGAPAWAGGESCSAASKTLLQSKDPAGYVIVQGADDEKRYVTWLQCDDPTLNLGTAVHEALHIFDAKLSQQATTRAHGFMNSYYIGPGEIITVKSLSLFPRSEIAVYLDGDFRDIYYDAYLKGSGSDQDFTM